MAISHNTTWVRPVNKVGGTIPGRRTPRAPSFSKLKDAVLADNVEVLVLSATHLDLCLIQFSQMRSGIS